MIALPHFRPAFSGVPLDPDVAAYAASTGISSESAAKINSFLARLTTAAGARPVFLHVAGSLYNNSTNTALVIGSGGTLVGGAASNPTSGTNFMRTGRTRKFLRANNPTAGQANWTWAQWSKPLERLHTHNLLNLRKDDGTEKGPLFIDETTGLKLLTSTNGNTNNTNLFPQGSFPAIINGGQFNAITRSSAGFIRTIYSAGHVYTAYSSVYNSHAQVSIGGIASTSTNDWELSACDFYATVAFNVQLTEQRLYNVRQALFAAGIVSLYTDVPHMISLGDSTTANRWNGSMHIGNQGGAWRNNLASGYAATVDDGQMGGKSFAWHYGKKQNVIDALNTSAWSTRYFVYTVDPMSDMSGDPADWASIGVEQNNFDAYYAKVEEWLLEIEAATGANIVACSYLKGNQSGTYRQAERDKVQTMADANGWTFVDFWADPHSQVFTGAVPGTYGFYEDGIHQTTAGRLIQAEILTSVLAHPTKTAAPRFDVANPPTITGTQQVGQTLTCSTGTLHVAGTSYTYQWLRNLAAISGATSSSYVLQAADQGTRIACRVTAVKTGENSASFTSAPTGAVLP